jgi:hypothetical protein
VSLEFSSPIFVFIKQLLMASRNMHEKDSELVYKKILPGVKYIHREGETLWFFMDKVSRLPGVSSP